MVGRLGQLEAVIMDRLWSYDGAVPVREVMEDLQRERQIAYTTVMTVMDNLHRKKLLTRTKAGRAFFYRPAQSREEHNAALVGEALSGSADRTGALLRFIEGMPPEEVARLREALTEQPAGDGSAR